MTLPSPDERRLLPDVVPSPTPSELSERLTLARQLALSALIPKALRGRPDDVFVVLLYGRELRLPEMTALQKIGVIQGRPVLGADLMAALVRRAGHRIWVTGDATQATATGTRAEDPETEHSFTFTLEDAVTAGLCTLDKDGKTRARDDNNKPLPWERYPKAMLRARAVSGLCRSVFPDALMCVAYTPEELGAHVDERGEIIEGEVVTAPPARPAPPAVDLVGDVISNVEVQTALRDALLLADSLDALRELWSAHPMDGIAERWAAIQLADENGERISGRDLMLRCAAALKAGRRLIDGPSERPPMEEPYPSPPPAPADPDHPSAVTSKDQLDEAVRLAADQLGAVPIDDAAADADAGGEHPAVARVRRIAEEREIRTEARRARR